MVNQHAGELIVAYGVNYKTGDPEYARKVNRRSILELFKIQDPISRFEIANSLEISKVTVSAIIAQLIENKIVIEVGEGKSMKRGGRKPILLSLNANLYVIGVDIGYNNITVVLGNLKGEIVVSRKEPTVRGHTVEKVVAQIIANINGLLVENNVERSLVLGIGVSTAGIVDIREGVIENSPDFSWYNVNFDSVIAEALGIDVIIDNCTRVMCRGELAYGCAFGVQNMFYVNVGHGVGSAMVINGEIYANHSEFGHVYVGRNDVKCDCGNYGCLEAVASGRAIERRANAEIVSENMEWITAYDLANLAYDGNKQAQDIYHDIGRYLGQTVSMVANFFSPEKIIFGGGIALSGDLFIDDIKREFTTHTIKSIAKKTIIRCSSLGEESAMRGSVALALDNFLFRSVF